MELTPMTSRLRFSLELKSLEDRQFEGYGAVFKNIDYGGDVLLPGAFKESLKGMKSLPPMFWMHQPDQVPGKWLTMKEDKHGLLVKGELADTQLGRETHTLLKMGAVTGMSIGYYPVDADYTDEGNRLLKQVELIETSIVSLPMNPLAQIASVKTRTSAAGEYVPTPKEIERHFRDIGCSKRTARQLVAKVYDGSGVMLDPAEEEAGETLAEAMIEKSGAMPDAPSRCDADDETKAAEMLQSIAESLLADRIRHRLARR